MSDLDFDPSKSLNVKSNGAVGLSIYFPLMANNNHMSISHRLGDMCTCIFFPISYHWPKILLPFWLVVHCIGGGDSDGGCPGGGDSTFIVICCCGVFAFSSL